MMQKSADELKNFFMGCVKRPRFISDAFRFYFRKACLRLSAYRERPFYPVYIKEHISSRNVQASVFADYALPIFRQARYGVTGYADDILKLPYGSVAFQEAAGGGPAFPDSERDLIFHRFNWLLTKLSEQPSVEVEWGLEKVAEWVRANGDARTSAASDAYSTSERVCNLMLFLSLAGGIPGKCDWLSDFVSGSAENILDRLEYYPDGRTSNHILNDARGLYFSGMFLGSEYYLEAARSIMKHELPVILTDDGFLREGSSHYQFLITSRLLEILLLARISTDLKIRKFIEDYAGKCVERCRFFLVFDRARQRWSIPLIGDVSPDFDPEWLMPLPWSGLALSVSRPDPLPYMNEADGWHVLFGFERSDTYPARPTLCAAFPDSGWYRLDKGRFTVFLRIAPKGPSLDAAHEHCDTGAFVLFIDGAPVMVDIGRYNYMQTTEGRYGLSAQAHNSLTIDGFEPFSSIRYPYFYHQATVSVNYEEAEDGWIFRIAHNGFSRILGDRIFFERILTVEETRFSIVDFINGKGKHDVRNYFHFHPEVSLEQSSTTGVQGTSCGVGFNFSLVNSKAAVDMKKGWYFPRYGERIENSRLEVCMDERLPVSREFVMEVL